MPAIDFEMMRSGSYERASSFFGIYLTILSRTYLPVVLEKEQDIDLGSCIFVRCCASVNIYPPVIS